MSDARDDLASVLERITARLSELESRVSSLEHSESNGFVRQLPPPPAITESHPVTQLSPVRMPGAVPAIGKLFLGIAGGYLLRALAESGVIPQTATVLLALGYAAGWLVWATRLPVEARFTTAAFATTATLIFSPMLWEITVRFRLVADGMAAVVVVAFVGLASALSWRRNLATVVWVGTFFPAVTALMLLVATRDPMPFACALLAVALLTECAGLDGRWRSLRPVAALLADSAILILVVLYSGQAQLPPEYKAVNTGMLLALSLGLFAIYGFTIAISTVVLRHRISIFEIGQLIAAFTLATVNVLRISHYGAAPSVGVFCLVLASVCYLAAVTRFDSFPQTWNYHVFTTWGIALVVLGSVLLLHPAMLRVGLSAAAVIATFSAIRFGRWSFTFHGAAYLALAWYVSGLWTYATGTLTGTLFRSSAWSLWTAVISTAICCAILWKTDSGTPHLRIPLRLFFSSLAIYAAAAMAIAGIVAAFYGGAPPAAPTLAVIRTFVFCVVILALSFSGARWNHAELLWIAYVTIGFCTLKLLYEDVPQGTTTSLATSLFLYGIIWILVPRFARSGNRFPQS